MVRSTIVQLTDDLDGGAAEDSISFGFRGIESEIDLNAKNAAALEKAVNKYVEAARRVPRSRGAGAGRLRVSSPNVDVSAIRVWARENGYEVSDRGRIPSEIHEAFEAAR